MLPNNNRELTGIFEADEAYIGGVKTGARWLIDKKPLVGAVER